METMNTNLIIWNSPEMQAIEPTKAETIRSTFEPMVLMLNQFEATYKRITTKAKGGIDKEITTEARRLRIDIAKVRISTEKLRKEQKEEYLRAGKAIDGVANILKWAVSDQEAELEKIEKHFENAEKERIARLQSERVSALIEYGVDAVNTDLGNMAEDVWQAYRAAKEKEYNDRIQAEKKAEADRIAKEEAERVERERMRVENERLKREAEERERIESARRAQEEAEKNAREEAARKEREAAEAKIKEAQRQAEEAARKEREAAEAKIKEAQRRAEEAARKEREAAEKLAALEREKQAEIQRRAEEAARQASEERERAEKELQRNDAEKISALEADLAQVFEKYSFKSKENQAALKALKDGIAGAIKQFKR